MKLTPREITIIIVGLILGLVAGVLLEAEADLFGTASDEEKSSANTAGGDKKSSDFAYYLVELDEVDAWLADTYPESADKFEASIGELQDLPTLWGGMMPDAATLKEQVDAVLPPSYAALQGVDEENVADYKADPDYELATCLGIDDNPYNTDGAVMYFYMVIPEDDVDSLEIPKEWEDYKLKRPQANTMYWKLVECYPYVDEEG